MGVTLCAFLLGALLVGYFTWDGEPTRGDVAVENEAVGVTADAIVDDEGPSPAPSEAATVEDAAQATEAVERVEQQQGGLDQRLAAAEQRLARLDLQAQAASGNAGRAEALLIAFAARRSLERGAELGYLADQLRLRFSDALPNAVNTVIETSRNPITIDQLIAQLDGVAPDLTVNSDEGAIESLRRGLREMFIIRRESTPSPQPERRVERARLFLQSGRVSSAIQEVESLPGANNAESWIADAKRYAAAQRALDLIETVAVVEPERLRDGKGTPIKQPGPGQQSPTEQ
ncbi:MICOS complex subunit MIC60 [Pontixanthobacter gangjinensis]|uniref:MICOS complex subunit MIC60 n=1 Tax=Pontixanthobacter gangjinensis TaxID=1028742 RepID=UPI001F29D4D8|nr:MICOS complex subunit MIC60 [Pontixanthobacter gangjinensis]